MPGICAGASPCNSPGDEAEEEEVERPARLRVARFKGSNRAEPANFAVPFHELTFSRVTRLVMD